LGSQPIVTRGNHLQNIIGARRQKDLADLRHDQASVRDPFFSNASRMRSCTDATVVFAYTVNVAKVRSHSPVSGFFQFSHMAANANGSPSTRCASPELLARYGLSADGRKLEPRKPATA
jgi:hypothetical protein